MKNNKKKTRMTKIEKRRLAFEKRNVKKEARVAKYGSGTGLDYAVSLGMDINRRLVALVLALVFVVTSVIVGVNFITKADDNGFTMFENID